tara:strand:- start:2059 stop:2676 length:618 start_codon:yes stop_codon:yes gene_type:complete
VDEFLALSEDEQKTLLKRLIHHALQKMRRLTWRGAYVKKGGAVPGAYEPEDFAHDAIRKMLDGTRPWNREKSPTLLAALKSTIDSEISHMVESLDNRKGRRLSVKSEKDETVQAYDVPGTEPNPLVIVTDRDWQERCHNAVMKALEGDKLLEELFDCLEAEITDPADIADMLEISVSDVTNAKKRLRRKLEKLDKKFPQTRRRAS